MTEIAVALSLAGIAVATLSGRDAAPFVARAVQLRGTIVLDGPITRVFPLFSPVGEKAWVEGWNPEILFPNGVEWARGMVFRTVSGVQEEIWTIVELDLAASRVIYVRVEPGRLVARVEVECRPVDASRTSVSTVYAYVGLSDEGNAHIAEWTETTYQNKMDRWQALINGYLKASRP